VPARKPISRAITGGRYSGAEPKPKNFQSLPRAYQWVPLTARYGAIRIDRQTSTLPEAGLGAEIILSF